MGFVCIATPAAADEASEALLQEGQSADADAAAATAPAAAPAASAPTAAAAPAPASLPVSAPTTTSATDLDLFGGQSGPKIGCKPGKTAWQQAPSSFSNLLIGFLQSKVGI